MDYIYLILNIATLLLLLNFVRANKLNIYLLLPAATFFIASVAFFLFPEIWIFGELISIEGHKVTGGGTALDASTASAFMAILSAFLGIIFVGAVFKFWRVMFLLYMLIYPILWFAFFYSYFSLNSGLENDDIKNDYLFSFLLIVSISLPLAIIGAWSDLCCVLKADRAKWIVLFAKFGVLVSWLLLILIVINGLYTSDDEYKTIENHALYEYMVITFGFLLGILFFCKIRNLIGKFVYKHYFIKNEA